MGRRGGLVSRSPWEPRVQPEPGDGGQSTHHSPSPAWAVLVTYRPTGRTPRTSLCETGVPRPPAAAVPRVPLLLRAPCRAALDCAGAGRGVTSCRLPVSSPGSHRCAAPPAVHPDGAPTSTVPAPAQVVLPPLGVPPPPAPQGAGPRMHCTPLITKNECPRPNAWTTVPTSAKAESFLNLGPHCIVYNLHFLFSKTFDHPYLLM